MRSNPRFALALCAALVATMAFGGNEAGQPRQETLRLTLQLDSERLCRLDLDVYRIAINVTLTYENRGSQDIEVEDAAEFAPVAKRLGNQPLAGAIAELGGDSFRWRKDSVKFRPTDISHGSRTRR